MATFAEDAPMGYYYGLGSGGAGYTLEYINPVHVKRTSDQSFKEVNDMWVKQYDSSIDRHVFKKVVSSWVRDTSDADSNISGWWPPPRKNEAERGEILGGGTGRKRLRMSNIYRNPQTGQPEINFPYELASVGDSAWYRWDMNFQYLIPPGWRLTNLRIHAGADDYIAGIWFRTTTLSGNPLNNWVMVSSNAWGPGGIAGGWTVTGMSSSGGGNWRWMYTGTVNAYGSPGDPPTFPACDSYTYARIGCRVPSLADNFFPLVPANNYLSGISIQAARSGCRDCEFYLRDLHMEFEEPPSYPLIHPEVPVS